MTLIYALPPNPLMPILYAINEIRCVRKYQSDALRDFMNRVPSNVLDLVNALQILRPGFHQSHIENTEQVRKSRGAIIEMDGVGYPFTPLGYVGMARDEITRLISLRQYFMDIAHNEGVNAVTEKTVKEGMQHVYGNKDDFLYNERLMMRLESAGISMYIHGNNGHTFKAEDLARHQRESSAIKEERDAILMLMAESIFNN